MNLLSKQARKEKGITRNRQDDLQCRLQGPQRSRVQVNVRRHEHYDDAEQQHKSDDDPDTSPHASLLTHIIALGSNVMPLPAP